MRQLRNLSRLATQQRGRVFAPSVSVTASSFHSTAGVQRKMSKKSWADPAMRQYKFWNRESSEKGTYSYLLDISPESIQREAKIIALADKNEPANEALYAGKLPLSTTLLGTGTTLQDFEQFRDQQPNVVFMWYVLSFCRNYLIMLNVVDLSSNALEPCGWISPSLLKYVQTRQNIFKPLC